jgi:hypothetical protein
MKKMKYILLLVAFMFLGFNTIVTVKALESNIIAQDNTTTDTDNDGLNDNVDPDNNNTNDDIDNNDTDNDLDTTDDDTDMAENISYGIGGMVIGGILTFVLVRSRRD